MNPGPSIPPSIDESARRRFEEAWRAGHPVSIAEQLPEPGDPRRLATLEELVHIELEFAWKGFATHPTGETHRLPLVEHYLTRFPELNQPEIVLRLLQQEFRVRRRHGDQPATAEYAGRFPALSSAANLDTVPGVERSMTAPRPPVAEGYEVLGMLGEGGMGVVYEARETRLGRVVALKTARPEYADDADRHGRFLTEARIAAQLEHPGIVPVHELVTPATGSPFYTMKLVRGRTLDAAIHEFHHTSGAESERAVQRRRLLEAFLAVTRTMAFAHSKGVIHRDIKPANIVLGDFGETVVLDWGLAKASGSRNTTEDASGSPAPAQIGVATPVATEAGSVLGTPAFMSPEQAAGRTAEVDERTDVYALGVVLYQILTGRLPHDGDVMEVLRRVQTTDPPAPRTLVRDVPRPLQAICLKALARHLDERYRGARELADDIERFLAGEPVTAYGEGPLERAGRWARRHRMFVAMATLTGLLSLIGAAVGVNLHERAEDQRRLREREHAYQLDQQRREQEQQQALADQRIEFERRRQIERERERQAAEAEALARAEFRSGRFHRIEPLLGGVADRLRDVPELASTAHRIEELRDWGRRLNEFQQWKDRAERSAFETDPSGSNLDPVVIASCEAALARLGPGGWWGRRPEAWVNWWDRLPPESLVGPGRLGDDATAVMITLALWRIKRGLNPILRAQREANATKDPLGALKILGAYDAAKPDFRIAHQLLALVRDYHEHGGGPPSHAADVVNLFCTFLLDPTAELQPVRPSPLTAADANFLGCAHILLAESVHGPTASREWVADMRRVFGRVFDLSGLDLDDPRRTAEQLFRKAIALDPGHYIARAQLAQSLGWGGDWAGEEQQWNMCIALRPGAGSAYQARCVAIEKQLRAVRAAEASRRFFTDQVSPGAARERVALHRRLLDGFTRAPTAILTDPITGLHRTRALWQLGEARAALEAGTHTVEMLAMMREAGVLRTPATDSIAEEIEAWLTAWNWTDPADREVRAALAIAHLARGENVAAGALAEEVLAAGSHSRALAVRGVLRLRTNQTAAAKDDFDHARDDGRPHPLATAGRAWVLARAVENGEQVDAALKGYDELLRPYTDPTAVGPPHLVAHLGRARLWGKVGDDARARAWLDDARLIDPATADVVARELFPIGRK